MTLRLLLLALAAAGVLVTPAAALAQANSSAAEKYEGRSLYNLAARPSSSESHTGSSMCAIGVHAAAAEQQDEKQDDQYERHVWIMLCSPAAGCPVLDLADVPRC